MDPILLLYSVHLSEYHLLKSPFFSPVISSVAFINPKFPHAVGLTLKFYSVSLVFPSFMCQNEIDLMIETF